MEDLKELIWIIKTGSPAEVRAAQKRVERLWHKTCFETELRKDFNVFLEEAAGYDAITDAEHRAYFINTLKWPLYFARPEMFTAWMDLLLDWVTRPEGKIRIAAVRAAQYLCVSMVCCFDEPAMNPARPEPPETREFARKSFCVFALRTEQLINLHAEPRFKRCKYIDALPVGVYKSLQQLLYESILTCEHFETIYENFLAGAERKAALPPHQPGHA